MTNIYIKGVIGKKFGNFFKIKVSSAMSAIKAIEANRNGFIKELFNLNEKNLHYTILCDSDLIKNSNELLEKRKIKNIYILPIVIGFGFLAPLVVPVVTALTKFAATELGKILISTMISLATSYLSNQLMKQSSPPSSQQNISVGGAAAAIEARGRSYVFSNRENVASQGSSIPVGYGLMKSSSKIISASIKNYSTDTVASKEFKNFQNSSIFLDYLTD